MLELNPQISVTSRSPEEQLQKLFIVHAKNSDSKGLSYRILELSIVYVSKSLVFLATKLFRKNISLILVQNSVSIFDVEEHLKKEESGEQLQVTELYI